MKLPASLTLALVLGAASLAANATTVIDFDDLPSSIGDPLPEGYADLSWDNFFFLEAANFGPSGYQTGTVSPPNVGFNAYGSPASFYSATPFTLVSADVTKAWFNGYTRFQGYTGSTLSYSVDVWSTTTGPTNYVFNWTGVDRVVVSDANGTAQSVIDNITIDGVTTPIPAVPEPGSVAMLVAGLGLLGVAARRRAR